MNEQCPKCGKEFDPKEDAIHECPGCGIEGSTACCNPGGSNCLCADCESEEEELEACE